MKEEIKEMRIDKWLWAVRLFKTRSNASEACHQNKVIIDHPVKASRMVRVNDKIEIRKRDKVISVLVLKLTENRIPAKLVQAFYEDLTPKSIFEDEKKKKTAVTIYREPGTGRPVKKERRMLDDFFREQE